MGYTPVVTPSQLIGINQLQGNLNEQSSLVNMVSIIFYDEPDTVFFSDGPGNLVFSEHGVYSILLTQIWHLYSLLLTLLPNQRLVDVRYNTTTSDSSFDE